MLQKGELLSELSGRYFIKRCFLSRTCCLQSLKKTNKLTKQFQRFQHSKLRPGNVTISTALEIFRKCLHQRTSLSHSSTNLYKRLIIRASVGKTESLKFKLFRSHKMDWHVPRRSLRRPRKLGMRARQLVPSCNRSS